MYACWSKSVYQDWCVVFSAAADQGTRALSLSRGWRAASSRWETPVNHLLSPRLMTVMERYSTHMTHLMAFDWMRPKPETNTLVVLSFGGIHLRILPKCFQFFWVILSLPLYMPKSCWYVFSGFSRGFLWLVGTIREWI